jgi:hypothetical protein
MLPFLLLGFDTDNDGKLINDNMLRCCQEETMTFTRPRANKKSDQAHIAEKGCGSGDPQPFSG